MVHLVFRIIEGNSDIPFNMGPQMWSFEEKRAAQLADTWLKKQYGDNKVLSKLVYDD